MGLQCSAVTTNSGAMMDPPQKCLGKAKKILANGYVV